MQNKTSEFSFILKKSSFGVGVFATQDIEAKTYLRLFGDQNKQKDVSVRRKKNDIPKYLKGYCIDRGNTMSCPKDFGRMEVGWFLNHSKTPNAFHRNYNYFALHDIKTGEEITINYNTLEEPEDAKDDYYK